LPVALPRLVDPDCPVDKVDVGDPERGYLAEPKSSADGDGEQITVSASHACGCRELGLGEEPQVGLRLADPRSLGCRTSAGVDREEALFEGVVEDAVQQAVVVGLRLQ